MASKLTICFEAHREDAKVWAVKHGKAWTLAESLDIQIPTVTVYKGKQAKQPKAYLTGYGVVRGDEKRLVISAV